MAQEKLTTDKWLDERFAEFVAELHKQRRRVENAVDRGAALGGVLRESDGTTFDSVEQPLLQLLRDQQQDAQTYLRQETFERAQYAMAVLADEIFVKHMAEWECAKLWQEHPLEVELFGTLDAARKFFKLADEVIASGDRADTGVARIFYHALCLGFEGLCDQKERADYMRRLGGKFGLASRRSRTEERIAPEAYQNIRAVRRGGLLPRMWIGVGILAGVALLAVVGLTVTYHTYLDDVKRYCREITNPEGETKAQPPGSEGTTVTPSPAANGTRSGE